MENNSKVFGLDVYEGEDEILQGFQKSNNIKSLNDLEETSSYSSFDSDTFIPESDGQLERIQENDNSDRYVNQSFDINEQFNEEYNPTDTKVNSNYQATQNSLAQVDNKEVRNSGSFLDELKSSKLLNKIQADNDKCQIDGTKSERKSVKKKFLKKQASTSSSSGLIRTELKNMRKFVGNYFIIYFDFMRLTLVYKRMIFSCVYSV